MNTASKFTKTEHLEDALKNRAYASPLNNLNDPYEFAGIRYPDEYRVCSFMTSNNKMLMWSHYGQGHHGIRIDFCFDDESYHHIEQVQYSKKLQKRQNECTENLKDRILEKAKNGLTKKKNALFGRKAQVMLAGVVLTTKLFFAQPLIVSYLELLRTRIPSNIDTL